MINAKKERYESRFTRLLNTYSTTVCSSRRAKRIPKNNKNKKLIKKKVNRKWFRKTRRERERQIEEAAFAETPWERELEGCDEWWYTYCGGSEIEEKEVAICELQWVTKRLLYQLLRVATSWAKASMASTRLFFATHVVAPLRYFIHASSVFLFLPLFCNVCCICLLIFLCDFE